MFARFYSMSHSESYKSIKRLEGDLALQPSKAYDYIFTPDGVDDLLPSYFLTEAEYQQIYVKNKNSFSSKSAPLLKAHDNPLSRFTSFFGFNNSLADDGKPQSWLNIGKNLVGWQDDASPARKKFNIIKSPLVLIWNLLTIVVSIARSALRVITEYIPYLLYRYCMYGMKSAELHLDWSHLKTATSRDVGYGLLFALALTGRIIFGALFFVGQAITSPVKNVLTMWKAGHDLATGLIQNKNTAKVVGHLLGGMFSLISMAVTIAVYTFALPIAIKSIGSFIVAKFPALANAVSTVANFLFHPFTAVGNSVSLPVFGKLYSALGIVISPAVSGFAMINTAMSLTTNLIKPKLKQGYLYLKTKWQERKNANSHSQEDTQNIQRDSVNNQAKLTGKMENAKGSRNKNTDPAQITAKKSVSYSVPGVAEQPKKYSSYPYNWNNPDSFKSADNKNDTFRRTKSYGHFE